jgi:LemA protein
MDLLLLLTIGLVMIWVIITYNLFIKRKHLVKEAWSGIDVQLKRRHSLIPNLVEAVKAHASYESETLSRLVSQRTTNSSTLTELGAAENLLSHGLRQLLAIAEAYPELKADQSYLNLQQNLSEVEEAIQYSRRYYNGTVRNLNILIESFPSNLIARLFNFSRADYFEVELATVRDTPDLKL